MKCLKNPLETLASLLFTGAFACGIALTPAGTATTPIGDLAVAAPAHDAQGTTAGVRVDKGVNPDNDYYGYYGYNGYYDYNSYNDRGLEGGAAQHLTTEVRVDKVSNADNDDYGYNGYNGYNSYYDYYGYYGYDRLGG